MLNLQDGCEYKKLNLSYCKFCIYTHSVKFKIYNMTLHCNIPIVAAIFLKHYGTSIRELVVLSLRHYMNYSIQCIFKPPF